MREEKEEIFKCGVCGKIWSTAEKRNTCETNCLKNAEIRAKNLKNTEKEKKRKEIQSRIDELKQVVTNYNNEFNEKLSVNIDIKNDYNYFTYVNKGMDTDTFIDSLTRALTFGVSDTM